MTAPLTRVRFGNVVASEFGKVLSLRSTLLTLLAIPVGGLGLSLLLALTMESAGVPDAASTSFALSTITLGPVTFGQLVAAVFGVLVIGSEYGSGTIQVSLVAVPARLRVLAAKTVVVFASVLVAAAVTLFGSWAVTFPLFDALGLAVGLEAPGMAGALAGGSLALALTAVFALGVGTLLRSAVGGMVAVLGVLLVLPVGLSVLGAGVEGALRALPFLPSSTAQALASVPTGETYPGSPLEPLTAGAVLAIVAAVTLVAGAVVLRRRDA